MRLLRWFTGHRIGAVVWIVLLLLVAVIDTSCGRKNKRKRGSSGATEGASFDPSKEQEISDKPSQIDTGDDEVTTRIVFSASNYDNEGRYLDEYLMVVRAAEESYVKLKAGPTQGISGADVDKAKSTPGHVSPKPGLRFRRSDTADHTKLNFSSSGAGKILSLGAGDLCSKRLFRMKGTGMYDVVAKTGVLVDIGSKVRVWLDDEVGNMCRGGSTPASLARRRFARPNHLKYDQLTLQHIQSVRTQAEQAITLLTGTYGEVSDVDGNSKIDVFISPDVNKAYFMPFDYVGSIDRFQPYPVHRPEDLAAYDPVNNPLSNEGEVIYLWAPDPTGIWAFGRLPSSNSLSSNFAKGFMGAQVMSLIMSNHKLIKRTGGKPEELWLVDALSLLGASYAAGNDFPFDFLVNYLSSRPQDVGLTAGSDTAFLQETLGMRLIFAWYLHAKACGLTVTPCAKLKDMIDTDKVGTANVEAFTSETFKKTLQNFGISVGTHLVDDPSAVRALWNGASADMPDKPTEMPALAEVNASDVTRDAVVDDLAATVTTVNDPTSAGPFPSYDMLLFQPLLPDNELDIKLAKDSVTTILVTGLVDLKTDVTAALGKQLNVTFIPLGKRDTEVRQIHQEKVSELGHIDQRPVNLTARTTDTLSVPSFNDAAFLANIGGTYAYPQRTYYEAPEYAADLTVNEKRELWVFGSIDTFQAREGESMRTFGDVDSYNIEIKPCQHTGCATAQEVVVQLYSRDYDKELQPMFVIGPSDLGFYRGHTLAGFLTDVDAQTASDLSALHTSTDYQYIPATCEHDGVTINQCANGGIAGQGRYNHDNTSSGRFATTFDNFLHSGPLGYPFLNNRMMTHESAPDRYPSFAAIPEENNRQFYDFNFTPDIKANYFEYFAVPVGMTSENISVMTTDEVDALFTIKSYMDGLTVDPLPGVIPESFTAACAAVNVATALCEDPWANRASGTGLIDAAVSNYLTGVGQSPPLLKRAFCYTSAAADCTTTDPALAALTVAGANTAQYLYAGTAANMALARPVAVAIGRTLVTRLTYYTPAASIDTQSICRAANVATAPQVDQTCTVSETGLMRTGDVRFQLDLASSEYNGSCMNSKPCGYTFGAPYKVFHDVFAFEKETTDLGIVFRTIGEFIPGQLQRETIAPAGSYRSMQQLEQRKGEALGKTDLFHAARFLVPASGAVINVMVGSRKQSQGKYLLRARVKNYN